MSGSVNLGIIVGNLGGDPEVRQVGDTAVANFSVATSEKWIDKKSGERKERTDWHRVSAWGPLAEIAGKYLRKGSKVYCQGQIRTRSFEQDGVTKYVTEIILQGFNSNLTMLDAPQGSTDRAVGGVDVDDEIPF